VIFGFIVECGVVPATGRRNGGDRMKVLPSFLVSAEKNNPKQLNSQSLFCQFAALAGAFFASTHQSPVPEGGYAFNDTSIDNGTIAALVQRQTDTIKKIVSTHHRPVDYPVITKYPADNKQRGDNIPLDQLKIKCQHLARLAATTTTTTTTTTPSPGNDAHRPGFYITTEEPPPTRPPAAPVKYIKLEPVILQKTMMSDGRTVYYWHKSIPTQIGGATVPSTPPPTTTTTQSGYNFRNFFPSFYSAGGSEPADATSTEKAPAQEVTLYQQQLKFVVPVPYAPLEDPGLRKPWEIDQYAYYPKPLQPDSVNVQVPYVPTFHVIKAMAVPNQYESVNVEGV
jgi:hypothetical protein